MTDSQNLDFILVSAIFSFSAITWTVLTQGFYSNTAGFISSIGAGILSLGLYGKYLSIKNQGEASE